MSLSAFLFFIANHLWQSTLFALAAGLVALSLKKNPARVRYWVWWLASMKFLIPFSLLVHVGSRFSWRPAPAAPVEPSVSALVFEQVAQPFTSSAVWTGLPDTVASSAAPFSTAAVILALVWFSGAAIVVLRWCRRWRRIRVLVEEARQVLFAPEGSEAKVLRRLQQRTRTNRYVSLVSSSAPMEPSVFGLFRPVLLWPSGLSNRLNSEELEAVLLHELSHVRRRDNLTAALHMMVTALFWFHPLIWWIGLRLVDERERACDEHVLRWGGGSETYAESILKVCEFCLESPLTCSAGVTGSDLKKRIEEIMRFHIGNPLKLSRIVLLMAVGITAVGGPIAIGVVKVAEGPVRSAIVTPPREPIVPAETRVIEGQGALETARIPREPQRAPQPPQAPAPQVSAATSESFEVVSIRPNTGATAGGARGGGPGARGGGPAGPSACGGGVQVNPGRFVATNVTLYRLITIAYGKHCRLFTEQDLLTGGPDWRQSAAFDIQATLPAGAPTTTLQQLVNGEAPQLQAMIRNMLADRFSLVLHGSSKEVPVYNLVIVRMGKIKLSEDQSPPAPLVPPTGAPAPRDPSAPPPRGSFGVGVDPPAGKVTIMASSIPIATMISFIQGGVGRMVVDKTEPKVLYDIPQVTVDVGPFEIAPGAVTVWPEIMNQLGLRMDPTRGPVEMLVIDRAEKPSEN